MKTFLLAAFLIGISLPMSVAAQQDSLETKKVLLREIIIQNDPDLLNSKLKKQPADVLQSAEEILDGINGVGLIRRGNFAMEPIIRGFAAGQITTTIDGMAIFGACTDRMDPVSSYIEPGNLQSIQVNMGANELATGNSIGGGFDFRLKQPKTGAVRKWSGMAGAGIESNGIAFQNLGAVQYSTEKLGVYANGIFRHSGNYKAGKGEEILFSQYTKWNGGISAKYKATQNQSFLLHYIQDEGSNIGYPALPMDVLFAKAKIASLSHTLHRTEGLLKHIESKIYFNTINHAMDDTKRPAEQVFMHMDMPGTSRTAGFYSEGVLALDNHEIRMKVNGYQNDLHAEMTMYPETGIPMFMLTIPDARRSVWGIALSDRYQISQKFELPAGFRTEAVSSSIRTETGRKTLTGIYSGNPDKQALLVQAYVNPALQINKRTVVYTNLARTMRQATLQEMYGFYLYNRMDGHDYIGNPDLGQESSWTISAGAQIKDEKYKAEVQVFGYALQNYIAGVRKPGFDVMTAGALGVKQYVHIPSAHMMGAEFSGEIRIGKSLRFSTQNAWLTGKDHEGEALPMISPFKSENEMWYKISGFAFGLKNTAAASQHHVSSYKYGESPTKGYQIWSFSASKRMVYKTTTYLIQAEVQNILDARYAEHTDLLKIPRMGRNISCRLTMYF